MDAERESLSTPAKRAGRRMLLSAILFVKKDSKALDQYAGSIVQRKVGGATMAHTAESQSRMDEEQATESNQNVRKKEGFLARRKASCGILNAERDIMLTDVVYARLLVLTQ